jgi:iron(III) transport system ATP-binding protein
MIPAISVKGLGFRTREHEILSSITLDIAPGSVLGLVGPSGSGKSTLLRLIAGLEMPTSGHVELGGAAASSVDGIALPAEKRSISLVSQELGLWPHMAVTEHLDFVLAARNVARERRAPAIDEMLRSVGLLELARQRPGTLSGGERQRLAIARAFAAEPTIILFDEPLANLDILLKSELLSLFRELLIRKKSSAIYVTHDVHEALELTEDLAILEAGRLSYRGSPLGMSRAAPTEFVQALLAEVSRTRVAKATTSS